jgi:K+-transporting ATPase c subunit
LILELGKLKEKNAQLKTEIFHKIGDNLLLDTRLYAEQDRKVEVKTTELMKFYKENDIMQQQQIRMQQEEIRRYRHAATVNKSTVEVQCNILDPDLSLQDKYIVAKRICAARKAEVASLKMQIDELRNGRVTEKQAEVGHSVEVQVSCRFVNVTGF